jgi:hypothetical protein
LTVFLLWLYQAFASDTSHRDMPPEKVDSKARIVHHNRYGSK